MAAFTSCNLSLGINPMLLMRKWKQTGVLGGGPARIIVDVGEWESIVRNATIPRIHIKVVKLTREHKDDREEAMLGQ